MDRYEDDEMMRRCEETSKEEEKTAKRKMEGKCQKQCGRQVHKSDGGESQ